jgi:hypothetical protein
LEWRLGRGETGDAVVQVCYLKIARVARILNLVFKKSYEFKLDTDVLNTLTYQVQYNCAKDVYMINSGQFVLKNWSALASSYSNMQRKVENDWKKCYLSRTPGSTSAFIEWTFEFSGESTDFVGHKS